MTHATQHELGAPTPPELAPSELVREPTVRSGLLRRAMVLWLAAFALMHLLVAGPFPIPNYTFRALHLAGCLVIVLFTFRTKRLPKVGLATGALLAVGGAVGSLYVALNWRELITSPFGLTDLQIVLGLAVILALLEATRRTFDIVVPILVVLSVLYALYGNLLPGLFHHAGFPLKSLISELYIGRQGLLGGLVGVSATVAAPFVIFGMLLQATGGGQVFIDLARRLAGWSTGGAGKVTPVSSALFGMISGSAVANIVVDGTFNIPSMLKRGYNKELAAGLQATASSGGLLMPPVMGAAAFVMAQFLGVSYWTVAVAAIIPAVLFYVYLFAAIHLEAKKRGYGPMPAEDLQPWSSILRSSAPLILPIIVLIWLLSQGASPGLAAFWSSMVIIALHLAQGWRAPRKAAVELLVGLAEGARQLAAIAVIVASSALIVALLGVTGSTVKVSDLVLDFGGGSTILLLILTAVLANALGAGLPTTAVYVLTASILAPALGGVGLAAMGVHMFIFYYASLAEISPPVCAGVYISCQLAGGANWVKASYYSCLFALGGLMAPFFFVLKPGFIIGDGWRLFDALVWVPEAVLCLCVLAGALTGYLFRRLSLFERAVFVAASMGIVFDDGVWNLTGLAVTLTLLVWVFLHRHDERAEPRNERSEGAFMTQTDT